MEYVIKDALTRTIINNYQIFVNGKALEMQKNIILQKIDQKIFSYFLTVLAFLAPIKVQKNTLFLI